jgi:opacity protein-like surface antigen
MHFVALRRQYEAGRKRLGTSMRVIYRKLSFILASTLVATGASAADMPLKAPAFVPPASVYGVYVGVFGGRVHPNVDPATDRDCASIAPLALIPCGTTAALNPKDGWRVGGLVGYQFNNWLRADFSLSHTKFSGDGLDVPAGTANGHADFKTLTGLFTGYLELAGLFSPNAFGPFRPYVGAGLGFSRNEISNVGISLIAAPTVTATFPGGTTTEFAWTVVAGTGVSLAAIGLPQATLDVQYRYIDHGRAVTEAGMQAVFVGGVPAFTMQRTGIQTEVQTHAVEVGLRWAL